MLIRYPLLSLILTLILGSLTWLTAFTPTPQLTPTPSPASDPTQLFPPDETGNDLLCAIDPTQQIPCHAAVALDRLPAETLSPLSNQPCTNGFAGAYPCHNIDLLSLLPLSTFVSPGQVAPAGGNDIWGWTDPQTSREYALVGLTNGTAFVDITDPYNPLYLGKLPSHTISTRPNPIWRDIKVYQDHAFIVADSASSHGVQIFDLTTLRRVTNTPTTFAATAHYDQVGSVHNIVINEETGYAYAVGTSSGQTACAGGLHMIDVRTPSRPRFAGCFSADGYTHDAQCVLYTGPDATYQGQEICFNANEDTLTIVNVNVKTAPFQISRTGYPFAAYSHQGWLTEDQRYLLMDDELDEQDFGMNTKTHIWDVADLAQPVYLGAYTSSVQAIDHNLYIKDNLAFLANYRAGLRVLDITGLGTAVAAGGGVF
jgi:choice-of-anchor B domain-containing protein